MNYFTRRTPPQPADYEEAYWHSIVDPDGTARNRLEEREKYLGEVKQELAFLEALPGGRILDIGCGLGFFLSGLGDKWEKYGVEVSRFASQYASRHGKIHVGELIGAHFPDGYFDAVVMYHVIEHIEYPGETILETRRIMKPGGKLILGTPDFDSGCARLFKENYRLLHDATHISMFSNESMHRFLRDHGFLIEKVEYPFFETKYFTPDNLMRLFDTGKISPPFYGNYMTFYCGKAVNEHFHATLMELQRGLVVLAQDQVVGEKVALAAETMTNCLKSGGKILVCGNGGSAACAQHFAAEFVGRLSKERQPLPAIALNSDVSVLTALGNDYGYDQVFARQVRGLGRAGDVLLAMSTSGRSPNILEALRTAQRLGLSTIALVGAHTESLSELGGLVIDVQPADGAQRVQELHTALLHVMAEAVERNLEK